MTETIKTNIVIKSADETDFAPLTVKCSKKGYSCRSDETDPYEITMALTYNGIQYVGKGTDYLMADALADLQTQLPHDALLCCCMTCRHVNMCPYGNRPGIMFCTKGHCIQSTDDLLQFWDRGNDASSETPSFAYCDMFEYQDKDHFTYNDYIHFLSAKNGRK